MEDFKNLFVSTEPTVSEKDESSAIGLLNTTDLGPVSKSIVNIIFF